MKYSDFPLTPGFYDRMPPFADQETEVLKSILSIFEKFGYERVNPPLLESIETIKYYATQFEVEECFRVVDPISGKTLILRSDITPQIVRIASTSLKELPRPLRLSYLGDIFQSRQQSAEIKRQKVQTGIEYIGCQKPSVYVEIFHTLILALQKLAIDDLVIEINMPALILKYLQSLQLDEEQIEDICHALWQKNSSRLPNGDVSKKLIPLFALWGDTKAVLESASTYSFDQEMFLQLQTFVKYIQEEFSDVKILLDLCEMRGYKKYNHISFSLFSKKIDKKVGRGGGYLLQGEPAIGGSLYLNEIIPFHKPCEQKNKILIVEGVSKKHLLQLHDQGFQTVICHEKEVDFEKEALRLGCSHVFLNESVQKIDDNK